MSDHHVERVDDPASWREAATPFFARDPLRSTIPMTVMTAPGFDAQSGLELFRVLTATGDACLYALRTPPFSLVLALGPPEGAAALAGRRDLLVPEAELPGVTGPITLVDAFATAYEHASNRRRRSQTELRLHALERLIRPRAPIGRGRLAAAPDAAALSVFFEGFAREVHMPPDPGLRARLDRGIIDAKIYVWEVDGELVSVAQHSDSVFGWSRVRLVYTPPTHRGKGYAAACVAMTSEAAMASGGGACLFTDLSNPTSNALYRRLGYEPAGDYREVLFT